MQEEQEEKTLAHKAKILYNKGLIQDHQLNNTIVIDKRWALFETVRQVTYEEANERVRTSSNI